MNQMACLRIALVLVKKKSCVVNESLFWGKQRNLKALLSHSSGIFTSLFDKKFLLLVSGTFVVLQSLI